MSRRRLTIATAEGAIEVRDLSLPGARLVELTLPDGRRARLAEHLCGWSCGDADALWPTAEAAVAAFAGTTGGGDDWLAVLGEYATSLGRGGTALPPGIEARLDEAVAAIPGAYRDGPRAQDGGGWYVFVGGLPGEAWIREIGETPEAAALAALTRLTPETA